MASLISRSTLRSILRGFRAFKNSSLDYISTLFQVFILLFAVFIVLFAQQFWQLLNSLKHILPNEDLRHLITHVVSQPLNKELINKTKKEKQTTGKDDSDLQEFDVVENELDEKGNGADSEERQEDLVEFDEESLERSLKALNQVRIFHQAVEKFVLRFNPFWKRTLEHEVAPEELNKRPHVYMVNHTSFADFLFCTGLGLDYLGVARADMLDLPIAGRVFKNTGLLPVHFVKKEDGKWGTDEAKTKEMLARAYSHLTHGVSILVFPEGTVNLEYEIAPFKPGFFRVAKDAGADIVPIATWGSAKVWPMARKSVPAFPMSKGMSFVKVGSPMKFLTIEEAKSFNSRETALEFIRKTYNFASEQIIDAELLEAVDKVVELNTTEIVEESFTRLVDKLFRDIVRCKIMAMRLELEDKLRVLEENETAESDSNDNKILEYVSNIAPIAVQ